jgi:ABC-type nitrate/sulfonate/bicarbonate transport system substrate-binding protein
VPASRCSRPARPTRRKKSRSASARSTPPTNTVTGGIIIKELGLLEKHLPRTGQYKDVKFKIDWQNFTSGPPITNGMMANKIHIGMMGDYPLLVNGATGQNTRNETQLIAIIAYNAYGGGNGMVVHKDSPYYELADLKGKNVSVPFGSAAHGMLLQAMQKRNWPENFWNLANQSPEVGSTNLQEKRIDGHADFVPFMELLPYRGFARKIFDGAETRIPTFHGVVVRKDFGQQHPDIVVAYIKALMDANDWVRKDPKAAAEKIAEWTRIDKEVIYIFLGPGGIHTLDPTIKPKWLETIKAAHGALAKMNRVKDFNETAWVNDIWVRQTFKERGPRLREAEGVVYELRGLGQGPAMRGRDKQGHGNRARSGSRAAISSISVPLPARSPARRNTVPRGRSSARSIWSTRRSASRCSPTRRSMRSAARIRRSPRSCRS